MGGGGEVGGGGTRTSEEGRGCDQVGQPNSVSPRSVNDGLIVLLG